MPFEVTVAGDLFQCKLDQLFGKIKQVIVIADDIMIFGKKLNHSNHDQALTTLLETARRCNVRLNYEKLQYKKEEVDFFGETYTTTGHNPDQSKVSVITKMSAPTCKKQVQSFIGMISYLSKFSARLSERAESIRELSKGNVPSNWSPEHQSAFTQMTKKIASASILAYYNPKRQTVLETDVSIKGLGACLPQEEKPVYFASKDLIYSQKGYVMTELELVAVAWPMEKFHHFFYANHFILETDQNLLKQFC